MHATQPGITPPAPGQEKEEPDLWQEDDIPVDNRDDEHARATGDAPGRAGAETRQS
jgi:hypothetical protein